VVSHTTHGVNLSFISAAHSKKMLVNEIVTKIVETEPKDQLKHKKRLLWVKNFSRLHSGLCIVLLWIEHG
jgi:hypothetical protein